MSAQTLLNNGLFTQSRYTPKKNEQKQQCSSPLMIHQSNTLLCEDATVDVTFAKHYKKLEIINKCDYKSVKQFKKEWIRGKQIGWGGFASVFEVSDTQRINPSKYVAKIIYFTNEDIYESVKDRQNGIYDVIDEYKFVKGAKLLQYYEIYIDKRNYTKAVIIMERLSHSLSSIRDSRVNIRKIAKDLAYNIKGIHDLHYVHLDLKKENVMWDDTLRKWTIIDYGYAQYISPKTECKKHNGFIGTKAWTAPEICLQKYGHSILSQKCDIYSYGLILLNLVLGGSHYKKIIKKSLGEKSEMNEMEMLQLFCSKSGNEMIQSNLIKLSKNDKIEWNLYVFLANLLKYSPNERPNIDQMLEMDYLKSELIKI